MSSSWWATTFIVRPSGHTAATAEPAPTSPSGPTARATARMTEIRAITRRPRLIEGVVPGLLDDRELRWRYSRDTPSSTISQAAVSIPSVASSYTTFQLRTAGVRSLFPARSTAFTRRVWAPLGTLKVFGEEQARNFRHPASTGTSSAARRSGSGTWPCGSSPCRWARR